MKFALALQLSCLIVALATAAPPLPQPGDSSIPLSKNCQIPKCPEKTMDQNDMTPVTFPYPLDCFQYVICNGSESLVVACPPDTIYDKAKGVCAPQGTVKCVPCYQEAP